MPNTPKLCIAALLAVALCTISACETTQRSTPPPGAQDTPAPPAAEQDTPAPVFAESPPPPVLHKPAPVLDASPPPPQGQTAALQPNMIAPVVASPVEHLVVEDCDVYVQRVDQPNGAPSQRRSLRRSMLNLLHSPAPTGGTAVRFFADDGTGSAPAVPILTRLGQSSGAKTVSSRMALLRARPSFSLVVWQHRGTLRAELFDANNRPLWTKSGDGIKPRQRAVSRSATDQVRATAGVTRTRMTVVRVQPAGTNLEAEFEIQLPAAR